MMIRKIKEKIESWDLKTFLLTICFVIVCVLFIYYSANIRDRFRQHDKECFKGQTSGEIISVEPIERITQSKWKGTEIFIDRYKVVYSYTASGQRFEKTNFIPVTTKNKKFIQDILNRDTVETFVVNFDEENPEQSILIENDEKDAR
jgi:hypothetical protein